MELKLADFDAIPEATRIECRDSRKGNECVGFRSRCLVAGSVNVEAVKK